jgi:hypothetical protein
MLISQQHLSTHKDLYPPLHKITHKIPGDYVPRGHALQLGIKKLEVMNVHYCECKKIKSMLAVCCVVEGGERERERERKVVKN